jgi:uncharacterized protein YlxW (UPF0749 family)
MSEPRGPAPASDERPEDQRPENERPEDQRPENERPEDQPPQDVVRPAGDGAPGEPPEAVTVPEAGPPAAQRPGDAGEPVPEAAPAGRRRRRDPLAAALIGVLTLLLGFAFAVQVRTAGTGEDYSTLREEDLVRILDTLDDREDRLREQIADQRAALRQLTDDDSQSEAALEEARERAEALGILNGTVAARGLGLVMTIRDPEGRVRVADLLDAVQELRGAGAETMQIDGVRVGVSTAITGEPGQLRVDGIEVDSPYEIRVIGSPQDLQTAMNIPGGVVDRVGRQGGSVDIEQSDTVVVDALRQLDRPQYAQPDTDGGN